MLADLSGRLAERSPIELLRFCEERRFSGELEWTGPDGRGVLDILGGLVAKGRLAAGEGDAIERFLAEKDGRFWLRQRLPTPIGGWVDEPACSGSLGPQLPAELLRFCESTGLSGSLTLSSGARHVEVVFARGEIASISLDGKTDEDLQEAWGWSSGEWTILADPFIAEHERSRRSDETGRQFLDVVERTLSKILAEAEDALPPPRRESLVAAVKKHEDDTLSRRVSLPLSPVEAPEQAVATDDAAGRRDSTVRIYYLRDLVPTPTFAPLAKDRPIESRTDLTAEMVDVPGGIQIRETDPPRTSAQTDAPAPWPYVWAVLATAAGTALLLWLLD